MSKSTFKVVFGMLLLLSNISVFSSSFNLLDAKQIPLDARRAISRTSKSTAESMKTFEIALGEGLYQSKTAYGVLLYDDELLYEVNTVVSFDVSNATSFSIVQALGGRTASAGAYAKDKYYVAFTKIVNDKEIPSDLYRIDLKTKRVEMVASLSGFDYMINDMSYDYSTNKMYAIAKLNNGNSALYTIDLTYGSSQKLFELDRHFFTLACSYGGQLYGVSRTGMFCKIDKNNGHVDEVGDTQIQPSYLQSMEFDHTDKTLYWAASSINETTSMTIIDVESGIVSPISALGSNAEIAGLYIPFTASADDTPSVVNNLNIQADKNGACSATLKWKNPTKTFGDTALEKLTKVEVYRDGTLICSKDNPIPGGEETFVDNIKDEIGLLATYKIIPINENGNGVAKEMTLFVGKDMPEAPVNLQLIKNKFDQITLSWEAAAKGEHGGWTDLSSLTYKVVRLSDNKVIKENSKETTCIDRDITPANTYSYKVISINSVGTGGASETSSYVLGPQNTIPYFCDFSTEELMNTWMIVNSNNDKYTWSRSYNNTLKKYTMNYPYSSNLPVDDWLIAHSCTLEKGVTYKFSFFYSSFSSHKLRFTLGKDMSPETMTLEIAGFQALEPMDEALKEFNFTIEETGDYHLGIQLYSERGDSWFYMTDIGIEQIVPHNLTAVSVNGNQNPIVGKTYSYDLTIKNKGTEPQERYKVALKDAGTGTVLAEKEVAESIQPEESKTIVLEWQPKSTEVKSIIGEVSSSDDTITKDNVTQAFNVNVQPKGSSEIIQLGISSDYSKYHPFNFYETKSAAMNIYTQKEIGQTGGVIDKVSYSYNNISGEEIVNTPIKIYMGNTERTDTKDGWISEQDLALVYDGTISLAQGKHELDIILGKNFIYTGKNLAILTIQSMEKIYYDGIQFSYYKSENKDNKALLWSGYANPFDFTGTGKQGTSNSSVSFAMQCDGTTVSGKVEDETNAPLEGVSVTLLERKTTVMTDAEGNYIFDYIPDGTYTIQCLLHGYPDIQSSNIVVSNQENVVRNIRMTNLPAYKIEGTVLTPDGQPVVAAKVKVAGYDNIEVITSSNGKFVFDNVLVADNYELAVYKDWYKTHRQVLSVKDTDLDLGEIKLDYFVYSPVNASTKENSDKSLSISWETPDNAMLFRKDDGNVSGQFGVTTGAGRAVLGTVYHTPTTLTEVSWYTTSEGGPHYVVNLFIFDLDASGNPTNKILYSAKDLKNTDNQWNNYTLPEQVNAPNGFMVALNYSGFLGLGVDSGESVEYPFENNTHACALDYTNGEFVYVENLKLNKNSLIRASGYVLADNYEYVANEQVNIDYPEEKPEFWKYKIWRLLDKDVNVPEKWTLLTDNPITETQYTDQMWRTLAPGVYCYAVSMVYPDGRISKSVFTPYRAYNMETNVTVRVKTNDKSGSAKDAIVTLTDSKGKTFVEKVNDENKVLFSNLWKGNYTIFIVKEGFESIDAKGDFSLENNYVTDEFILKEIMVTPFNLQVKEQENQQVLFSWNTTGMIFDDFESHDDFAINSAGKVGWQYLDLDKGYTYAFTACHFLGEGAPMAFIVFNPSSTEPSVADVEEIGAYSGSKFLACFAAQYGNNDYLISPELKFIEDFTFSFFAKSYSNYEEYTDPFNVGYSLTGIEPEDFIWVAQNVVPSADNWNEYSYTIPADARYVTINCVSTDGFVLMIDDVLIGTKDKNKVCRIKEESNVVYEVYLDGKKVSETTDCKYLFAELTKGKHTAGVKAVYYSGSSELVTCEFGNGSNVDYQELNTLHVYPNPAKEYLKVEGDYTRLELQDISGRCIVIYEGMQETIDVSQLPEGIYLLTITNDYELSRKVVKVRIRK